MQMFLEHVFVILAVTAFGSSADDVSKYLNFVNSEKRHFPLVPLYRRSDQASGDENTAFNFPGSDDGHIGLSGRKRRCDKLSEMETDHRQERIRDEGLKVAWGGHMLHYKDRESPDYDYLEHVFKFKERLPLNRRRQKHRKETFRENLEEEIPESRRKPFRKKGRTKGSRKKEDLHRKVLIPIRKIHEKPPSSVEKVLPGQKSVANDTKTVTKKLKHGKKQAKKKHGKVADKQKPSKPKLKEHPPKILVKKIRKKKKGGKKSVTKKAKAKKGKDEIQERRTGLAQPTTHAGKATEISTKLSLQISSEVTTRRSGEDDSKKQKGKKGMTKKRKGKKGMTKKRKGKKGMTKKQKGKKVMTKKQKGKKGMTKKQKGKKGKTKKKKGGKRKGKKGGPKTTKGSKDMAKRPHKGKGSIKSSKEGKGADMAPKDRKALGRKPGKPKSVKGTGGRKKLKGKLKKKPPSRKPKKKLPSGKPKKKPPSRKHKKKPPSRKHKKKPPSGKHKKKPPSGKHKKKPPSGKHKKKPPSRKHKKKPPSGKRKTDRALGTKPIMEHPVTVSIHELSQIERAMHERDSITSKPKYRTRRTLGEPPEDTTEKATLVITKDVRQWERPDEHDGTTLDLPDEYKTLFKKAYQTKQGKRKIFFEKVVKHIRPSSKPWAVEPKVLEKINSANLKAEIEGVETSQLNLTETQNRHLKIKMNIRNPSPTPTARKVVRLGHKCPPNKKCHKRKKVILRRLKRPFKVSSNAPVIYREAAVKPVLLKPAYPKIANVNPEDVPKEGQQQDTPTYKTNLINLLTNGDVKIKRRLYSQERQDLKLKIPPALTSRSKRASSVSASQRVPRLVIENDFRPHSDEMPPPKKGDGKYQHGVYIRSGVKNTEQKLDWEELSAILRNEQKPLEPMTNNKKEDTIAVIRRKRRSAFSNPMYNEWEDEPNTPDKLEGLNYYPSNQDSYRLSRRSQPYYYPLVERAPSRLYDRGFMNNLRREPGMSRGYPPYAADPNAVAASDYQNFPPAGDMKGHPPYESNNRQVYMDPSYRELDADTPPVDDGLPQDIDRQPYFMIPEENDQKPGNSFQRQSPMFNNRFEMPQRIRNFQRN